MSPNIWTAKITLSCPLFSTDFDPQNNGFLLVGGGGGEGRSGVGNKISLLNTHRRDEISEVVEIELSPNEDSVASLGISRSSDDSIIALAGINSSQAEQQLDRNEHLRSFKVGYPSRKAPTNADGGKPSGETQRHKAKTTALSRTSLFRQKPSKPAERRETYQRLLRLSPWKGEKPSRIAAIATGLAPQGEIVVFNATSPSPQESDILTRIQLGHQEEAEDIDIIETGSDGEFKVAYTDGVSVFTFNISPPTKLNGPPATRCIYTVPFPDTSASSKKRATIRALRALSPISFILLLNLPDRAGCELVVLSHLDQEAPGNIKQRRRLHTSMRIGLGLDVCHLPEASSGEKQYVVAVSGNDSSIQLFTIECVPTNTFTKFRPYARMRNVHPFTVTRIAFSTSKSPRQLVTSDGLPQYIKLASVSVGNTVVVHTLPLFPYRPSKSQKTRYVLVSPGPSELLQTLFSGFMALLVVGIGAFLLQAFAEIRGGVPPTFGATNWLSPRLREIIAKPYIFDNDRPGGHHSSFTSGSTPFPGPTDIPSLQTPQPPLRELLSASEEATISTAVTEEPQLTETPKMIIVHDHGTEISARTQPAEDGDVPSNARKWEDLTIEERELWKRKLSEAGHWALEEGEEILKGVFFGELAGFVRAAVMG